MAVIPSPGWAGEVAGRVMQPVAPVAAGFSAPSVPGSRSPSAAGPALVYVGEAAGELSRIPTVAGGFRLARGGLAPRLLAVSLGSAIEVENTDRRSHRLVSRRGPARFNLGVLAPGARRQLEVNETGVISVECALHGDMRGEIVVLAHSAFAVTDAAGGFLLPDLPPGRATIVAYVPGLGEISREVEVPESGRADVAFTF